MKYKDKCLIPLESHIPKKKNNSLQYDLPVLTVSNSISIVQRLHNYFIYMQSKTVLAKARYRCVSYKIYEKHVKILQIFHEK